MSEYAYSVGWNVPLVSLHNVENHLGSVNRRTLSGELVPVTVASSIIDPFPVRVGDQSGGESGDGFLMQDWSLTLALYGYKALLDEVWASETVVQTAVTVYTRRHTLATFQRYNAWALLPSAVNGDISFLRESSFNNVFRIRVRLRDLTASS